MNCCRPPCSLARKVLTGMKTTSSWSPWPIWPLVLATPITSKGTWLMRTCWPIGSEKGPKRLSTTLWPSTATLVPIATSDSSNNVPRLAGQLVMVK